MREHRYYVYIVVSRSHTLYIGVTSAIERRIEQHRNGQFEGFSSQYNCNRLVHLELYDDIKQAIGREKQLKRWSRSKKITLIERTNPTWQDLSEGWGEPLQLCDTSRAPANKPQVSPLRFAPVEMTTGKSISSHIEGTTKRNASSTAKGTGS